MRKLFLFLLLVGVTASAMAQSNAAWLRYPAISPDGKTIAFGYKGDIYRVDVNGGVAVRTPYHSRSTGYDACMES